MYRHSITSRVKCHSYAANVSSIVGKITVSYEAQMFIKVFTKTLQWMPSDATLIQSKCLYFYYLRFILLFFPFYAYISQVVHYSSFQINVCMIFPKKVPHRFHKSRPFHSLHVVISINFLNDIYRSLNLYFSIFTLPTVFIF